MTILRIGTRGSPLALAQASDVQRRLLALFPDSTLGDFPLVVIKTTGDKILDRSLAAIGGKGLFTKELEEALVDGNAQEAIDIAVHSMKDVPAQMPDVFIIGAVLEREDVRDAFISPNANSIADLPEGAVVGTSSSRRRSQLLAVRPDFQMVDFRGNVQTRLRKLADGVADATILAVAGLNRLGMSNHITAAIAVDIMLPAVGQGAVALQCRKDDATTYDIINQLNHIESEDQTSAERGFMIAVEGSCKTPIAAMAVLDGDNLHIKTLLASLDGSEIITAERKGDRKDAVQLGRECGEEIRKNGAHILQTLVV